MANKKRRGKRAKKNPTRKGKMNRWIPAKAVRVRRNKGRLVVDVRR